MLRYLKRGLPATKSALMVAQSSERSLPSELLPLGLAVVRTDSEGVNFGKRS